MARYTILVVGLFLALLAEISSDACADVPAGEIRAADVERVAGRQSSYDKSLRAKLRDPEDGAFDVSRLLAERTGFLPTPIFITEPAVGLGGGIVATFFHGDNKGSDGKVKRGPTGRPVPESMTAVGGLVTENGTWGVFGGHLGIWKNDRIRYTGGGGYVSVNLDYYGLVGSLLGLQRGFNIEGFALVQDVQFRLGNTPLFAGVRYVYFQNQLKFEKLLPVLPNVEFPELDSRMAGASVDVMLDTRDNMLTPNRGVLSKAQVTFYEEWLGSDFSYVGVDAYVLAWTPISKRLNLGVRLDLQHADSGAPFYALPFISLRGIPAMRYQGNSVAVAETELRWDFTKRWSLVGFGGIGRATKDAGDLLEYFERDGAAENAWNVGGGFRYLIARRLGIRMGIDIARGPEDWAFYITMGNSWLRP